MTMASARRASRAEKRGWERRYHHVIFVVDRDGKMVQWWPQHDKLFEMHVRARAAQDQDEPVRSREARVGVSTTSCT